MTNPYIVIVLGILGFISGSFLSAYTYRAPLGKSVKRGRSFCSHCKKIIKWYDNVPLFSFVNLGGKCRDCGKKISSRYPLIELTAGFIFPITYILISACTASMKGGIICSYNNLFGVMTIPFFIFIFSVLIAIFIIDFENQIIPDELVYLALIISIIAQLIFFSPAFFINLLLAFSAGAFLLMINLGTKGKGMGLGDVKLALLGGFLLGWPETVSWLYLSFVIGAVIGIILIITKKAKFGRQIAFGPFLIVALFVSLLIGNRISEVLFSVFP